MRSTTTCLGFIAATLLCASALTAQSRDSVSTRDSTAIKSSTDSVAIVLAEANGTATYYADKFDGRRTASGIVFWNSEPYAAHRDYPFGTVVRVTNTRNGRTVTLEVVDRGPNGAAAIARNTIIDVSRSAAEELGFVRAGRVPVRVEVLSWGNSRK